MVTAYGTPGNSTYVDPFKPVPPPPVVPPSSYKGPVDMSINNTQQGADLVNANKEQAAKMGITLPGSTYTPPKTDTTSTTTSSATSAPDANRQKLEAAQKARDQADADYQAHAQQVQTTIENIQNGTTPLTAGQQAQIDGLKQQFKVLIDQQLLVNKGAEGMANIRGYQKGAAEYDPTFQVKTIGSIITAGQQKIADLNTKMASAVAQLTQAFHDNDIKAVTDAYKIYQDSAKQHADVLQSTIDDAHAAIKEAHDLAKEEQDRKDAEEKNFYERTTKPIQEIASSAAANGASKEIIAAISNATSVSDAISMAGDTLQTATGDAGAYLFAKRQAATSGKSFPDFDTWSKNLEQQKINTELSKYRQQKEIDLDYNKSLEKAKAAIANAPTPNYNGEFAATIKLASQAGGTNAQRNQIKADLEDFISQGDYKSAYTQILTSASDKLSGGAKVNFQNQLQSFDVMKDMRAALQEYRAAGGDTNIFKGGADSIQTKIGALATDPKYAAIATRLNMAFQQYRLNMTGAAFGAKESSEYASVLPSAGNTFALNMAKMDGAESYLNGQIESTIKNTIGEGGVYIKQYAEAGNQTVKKQEASYDKISEFREANPDKEEMIAEMHAAGLTEDEVVQQLGL